MIKRFDFCSFHGQGSMENDPEGIYCLHDDYEAMEKRAIAAEAKLAEIEKQELVAQEYPFAKLTESQILTKMHPQPIYPSEFNSGKQIKIEWADVEIPETENTVAAEMPEKKPVQQSPVVAVSENVNDLAEDFIDGMITTSIHDWEYIDVKNAFIGGYERATLYTHTPNTKPKQRITEQDALGFAMSTLKYWIQVPNGCAEDWLDRYGRTLLAKLNEAKNV